MQYMLIAHKLINYYIHTKKFLGDAIRMNIINDSQADRIVHWVLELKHKFSMLIYHDTITVNSMFYFCLYIATLTLFITTGKERLMTDAEERILFEGKNFEHTFGAVHTSNLEILVRLSVNLSIAVVDLYTCMLNEYTNDLVVNIYIYIYYIVFIILTTL
jgi:hypothetical protein